MFKLLPSRRKIDVIRLTGLGCVRTKNHRCEIDVHLPTAFTGINN